MAVDGNLTARGIDAVLWGGFGATLRLLIQVGASIALARILGPDQYGLFVMGVIVVSLASFFADIGLAYGLIQKPQVSAEDIRFVFSWQVVLGAVVAAAVAGSSEMMAAFFREPRAEAIVCALAAVCFVNALGAVSLNLLKRRLDFKRLHLAQAASYFVGFVLVGIPLALAGAQAWALVAAFTVQAVLAAAMMYTFTRHELRPLYRYDDARYLGGYGSKVLATNLINWTIGNIDRVFVGRFFPSASVGVYSTAYNLVNVPTVTLLGVLQSSLFAVSSRAQDRPERLRSALLAMLGAVALFLLPVYAAIGAVPETLVLALYGEQWRAASELLRPIAWAMPFYLLLAMATPSLWASGRTGSEFLVQVPVALLWVVASAVAVQYSLAAVAWTVLGLFVLRCMVLLWLAGRAVGLTIPALAHSLAAGVLTASVVATAVAAVDGAIGGRVADPQMLLLIDVFTAALSMVAALALGRRLISPELLRLVAELSPRLPARLGGLVSSLVGRGLGAR